MYSTLFFLLKYRIGVSYYDSTLRQLYVLEAWDDGDKGFPVIDLGMIFFLSFLNLSSILGSNLHSLFLVSVLLKRRSYVVSNIILHFL